jgi:ketosteroid isomerase-like protein
MSDAKENRERIKSVTLEFVKCINNGNSEGLKALQTEDFTFIDMAGDVHRGRDGWEDYFTSYPEYKIHVENLITSGNGVAIIGTTTGSHVEPEVEEKETILWTAEIRNGSIAEWRIYGDVYEIRESLSK